MDLLSEESSGARVLAPRHINVEKAVSETGATINASMLCHTYSLQPDFHSYFATLHTYAWLLWSYGILMVLATCILYALTMRAAARHWRPYLTNVAVVLAVYPIVAGSAFVATVVPRSRIIAEAIAQEVVMVAMYHLYCIMVKECGGVDQMVRRSGGSRLETRVLPCCCWPCCPIPRPVLQKQTLTGLRWLILQLPIVQALIYVVILVLWAEDMELYLRSFVYMQPLIVISILCGVWGIIMCVRAAEGTGARPRGRFLVLQLALLIVKLQCGFAKLLPELTDLPCNVALHPSVFVNMIQNSVMLFEMLLLSIWACRLYSVPPGKDPATVPRVAIAVLEDSLCSYDSKKDGFDNRNFERAEAK